MICNILWRTFYCSDFVAMIEKAGEDNHKNSKGGNRKSVMVVDDDAPQEQQGKGGCC